MSDKPQLPGYSIDDDDTHDDNNDAHHIDVVTAAEPERPVDQLLSVSAGDAVVSTGSVSSQTRQDSTQSWLTSLNPQEAREVEYPTTAAITTTPPPLEPVDEFANPKISGLHAIFPDYDAAILHSIVDSVGGDQDRAVDALLAMSDPDHVPAHHTDTEAADEQPSSQAAEQTQLDEEFARQLLLEDEQQYARDQIALRQQQEQMRQFPYAQRTHTPINRGDAAQQQQQSLPQRDTMSDMQEQFSKLAETGKRTFSSLVSKVKAKVQDFDSQRNIASESSSSSGPGTTTNIGTGYVAQPPSPGLDRHAQQAYYAPRVSPNPQQPGTISNDDFENPPLVSSSAAVDRGLSASTPPPPATNSGRPVTNIDPGKIGLLPKRPVSLVNTESPSSHTHDEDEEELEYVENPFDEGKYS